MNQEEIGAAVRLAMKHRRQHQQEAMHDYDAVVYNPHLKQLRQACSDLGHIKGKFHSNGLGWHWWYCSVCGASFDKREE